MEAAAALEKRERLVIGPRSGSSRRRTRSLRRVDGYGGRRVAVAAAPASAPSVSMASSAVDPSIWGLLEVQDASIHLIAAIFVEATSLIDQSIPPMLFQYLPCFCINCVFALPFSTSSRTECQAYQTFINAANPHGLMLLSC
uniref:Uncharacterized protein n=1 Tax=Aegilops tauschii subsp. strangulata TaxID=200361 RepID=A0A453SH25_AEGTS